MSIRLMTLVWSYYPTGGGELILALAISDHAHDDGTRIFPGVPHLARKTRQSERAVQYQLRRMESALWLQPVRYLNGGKGKAREYRINPDWIGDPENFAPFQKVQVDAQNDAPNYSKGCNSFAPQPSETSFEPPTTSADTSPTVDASEAVVVENVFFPPIFSGDLREAAEELLSRCPSHKKQSVLYEVAGIAANGLLKKNGIGLLAKLVNESIAGSFVPSYALTYQRQLQREEEQRVIRETETVQQSGIDPAEQRQIAALGLAKVRAALQPAAAKAEPSSDGSMEDADE